jgi:hypothetical protein
MSKMPYLLKRRMGTLVFLPILLGFLLIFSGYNLDNPLGTIGTTILISVIGIFIIYLIIRFYRTH